MFAIRPASLMVAISGYLTLLSCTDAAAQWKKHVVHSGFHTSTAVGGDFTGDGKPDVISNSGGKTRLFVAPDWKELILDDTKGHDFIHSETFDVDDDGDLDFIGARYSPGLVVWLERPKQPLTDKWVARIAEDKINGIHGLLKGELHVHVEEPAGIPAGPE